MPHPRNLMLPESVRTQILKVQQYLDKMQAERQGWGALDAEYRESAESFRRALVTLLTQTSEVWIDGEYSFGGVMGGYGGNQGIVFGMIATKHEPQVFEKWVRVGKENVLEDSKQFEHGALTWSFHS